MTPLRASVVACSAAFSASVSTSFVAIALPMMASDLHTSRAHASWVLTAYLVTVSLLLVPMGRFSDAWGARPVTLFGFTLFVLAAAACGFAPSLPLLVSARVAQGIGASALMAVGPAMLTRSFPPSQRGRALGLSLAVTYVGLTIGPGLGGIVTQAWGYRAVFFCVAAFASVALVLATLLVESEAIAQNDARIDVVRTTAALFRAPPFTLGIVGAIVMYSVTFVLAYLLPFHLQRDHGLEPGHAGALMTAQPATMSVVAPFSGFISDRFGPRVPTTLGMITIASGLLLVARFAGTSDAGTIAALAVMGAGAGLYVAPNSALVMTSAPRDRQGTAAAVAATARNVGMATGIGLAVLLRHALGFERALFTASVIAIGGALLGLVRPVVRA